jgi:hypothetical protein
VKKSTLTRSLFQPRKQETSEIHPFHRMSALGGAGFR